MKAFPHLFVDGEFGLNHERKRKLTSTKFYAQRIMNEDDRYAKEEDFVFMAHRHSEMDALEGQINMSTSHGSLEATESDGSKLVPSNATYYVFMAL